METSVVRNPIPLETAIELCAQIRAEAELNWHTAAARWCWNCQKIAGGDPARCGFLRKPGNRGCILVNVRYAQLRAAYANLAQ